MTLTKNQKELLTRLSNGEKIIRGPFDQFRWHLAAAGLQALEAR